MQLRASFVVATMIVIPACYGLADMTVAWQAGNAYSSSFLYNGFTYRVIRIFDSIDSTTGLLVGVAGDTSIGCPGPGRRCTTALLWVGNEGTNPFDIEPKNVDCVCLSIKPKPLGHYSIPSHLRNRARTVDVLLKGNTVFPGDHKTGAIIFSGACAVYQVRVAITLSGRRVSFEFPFVSGKR